MASVGLKVIIALPEKAISVAVQVQLHSFLKPNAYTYVGYYQWAKVRQVLHGRNHNSNSEVAGISKDHCYTEPRSKLPVLDSHSLISEMDVFYMLDRLKPTAMGLDAVPAWFLQMGAPAFAAPLATLLNQSFSTSVVPRQWKYATITPVYKTMHVARKSAACAESAPQADMGICMHYLCNRGQHLN